MRKRIGDISVLVTLLLVMVSPLNVPVGVVGSDGEPGNFVAQSGVDWWPMFHHDLSHTGYSTSKGPNTNNKLWARPTGDAVFSSPAVSDGRVYIGSNDYKLYCLNALTGNVIWTYTTDSYVRSSPAVACGYVYVGSFDNNVYCLPQDDPNGDGVITSGEVIWARPTGDAVFSSPAVSDGRVYIGSNDYKLYCLNALTGNVIWTYTTGGIVYSPTVAYDNVYVGSGDYKLYCLPQDDPNGDGVIDPSEVIWSYQTAGFVNAPAVIGGKVYGGAHGGKVYCLNALNGNFIWSFTIDMPIYSSAAVACGYVYVGSNDKNVYCLPQDDPNGDGVITSGEVIWTYWTGGYVTWSSPAVADDKVYIGSGDCKVHCLDAFSGGFIWTYTTGSTVYSSPAVACGRVYVGSSDNEVYAFGSLPVHNLDTHEDFATIQAAINDPDTTGGHTIFVDEGTYFEHVVVDKSLSLIGENRITTVINGNDIGTVMSVTANNVNITCFTIRNSGTSETEQDSGIHVSSIGNNISYNIITNNGLYGMYLSLSSQNIVVGNDITNNEKGIELSNSNNNKLYHNNFINNTDQVISTLGYINVWHDLYPSGGNHWNNYLDEYPSAEELNYSGIWNIPYKIDDDNIDRYPLMKPYGMSMRVIMTENVKILPEGSCELNLSMIVCPPLSKSYSHALGFNEAQPTVHQPLPETIPVEGPKNLTFNESIEVIRDTGVNVSGQIPVNSTFCNAIRDQQQHSLGINITEEEIKVTMWRVGEAFMVFVGANATFLKYGKSGNNWNVSIGPSNINASTDRANFILTQIMFLQQMLDNFAGEQTYNSTWITNIILPAGAVLNNSEELFTVPPKNWTMEFGGGTYMKSILTSSIPPISIVLTETMGVTEEEIIATEPKELVASSFLCYKVFDIKYWLLGSGSTSYEIKGAGCVDDFSWGIDLTLLEIKQDLALVRFSDTFPINESTSVGVGVDMGVNFTLKLKAHLDLKTKWFSLRRFRAYLQLDGSLNVYFDVSANATLYDKTWNKTIFQWKSKKPHTFMVGPVLVEVRPHFNAMFKINVNVYGEVSIHCGAEIKGLLRAGVGWKKDNGFYPILNTDMDVTREDPSWNYEVGVVITPSLVFSPTLLFYDTLGPSAEIEPYAKLHMYVTGTPPTLGYNLTAGVNVNAGLAFANWAKKIIKLKDYYWNILNWVFWVFPREGEGEYDVAVKRLRVPSQTFINENLTISVDVENVGDCTANVNVTLYYKKNGGGEWTPFSCKDEILTTVKNVTGSSKTFVFEYNTTEMTAGDYFISANASILNGDGCSDEVNFGDNSLYNLTRLDERNVAVVDVTPSKRAVSKGEKVDIKVTVENKGTTNVSVLPVFVYYEGKPISDVWCEFAHWVFDLEKDGGQETLTFTWDTARVELGEYIISAEADRLLYETSYFDNKLANGTIKVQLGPLDVSINPTSVTMDVFQSELFNSTVSGGTPPYTYQWYKDGVFLPGETNPILTFTPVLLGSYTIYLNVTDNAGVTAKSNIADITVNPELGVSISPDEVVMDEGESQEFTSEVTGGTPPYDYQWYVDDSPVSGATNPTYTYTPPSPSTHTIHLKATDSAQATKNSNTAHVTVNPIPTGTLTVSTTPVEGAIYVNGQYKGTGYHSGTYDIGTYTVSFGSVSGYYTPATQYPTVYEGQETNVIGHYTPRQTQPRRGGGAGRHARLLFISLLFVGNIPIVKPSLIASYMGLTSTILVATAIYVKRVKHRKEK